MGTDNIGRDYFSRIVYAGRISLTVALLSVFISETIGILVGSVSGFYGGWLDAVLMRFVEFMLTIPSLPLLLIISSMLLRNEDLVPIPSRYWIFGQDPVIKSSRFAQCHFDRYRPGRVGLAFRRAIDARNDPFPA